MKPFSIVQVDGPLYLSNKVWVDRDLPTLRRHGINAIVNLVEDHAYPVPRTIACIERGFHDGVHVAQEVLHEIYEFIDSHRARTNVLVHCAAGSSRSAGVVIGQLMREHPDWTWSQAHRVVDDKRPIWVSVEMRESVLAYLAAQSTGLEDGELCARDLRTLRELERATGVTLRPAAAIGWNTQGYVVEDTHVVGLGISDAGLASFPCEILELHYLRELQLGRNRIESIPSDIAKLHRLQYLSLFGNCVASLAGEIGQLGQLRVLNFTGNNLQTLPGELGRLRSLERLSLHDNCIQRLPDELGELVSLTELSLDRNRLERLPPIIGRLHALEYLSASSNRIQCLPTAVDGLKNLRALNLGKNRLRSLPEELGRLAMLDNLNVSSNQLESLPPECAALRRLRRVNVALNRLASLSPEVEGWLNELQRQGATVIREGWKESSPAASRPAAQLKSLPIVAVESRSGVCGCGQKTGAEGAIVVNNIDQIREPNRCGIANPSRAFRMMSRIVLDITYKCSLECPNCNRLCGVSPRTGELAVAAVREFVDESIAMNKKWAHIYIAGGEPSLHSDVEGVFAEVLRYREFHKQEFGSALLIKYFTSSHSPRAQHVLANLPEEFIVVDSHKTDSKTRFKPICVAPIDLGFYDDDNVLPCQESYQCGIALTHRGYYPCAVAAAIDDVLLNGDLGVARLRDVTFEGMAAILHETCRYCGHYFEPLGFRRESELMLSETWQRFLQDGVKPERPCRARF